MSNTQRMLTDKVSQNDDTINKVTSLEIIVRMIDSKPYYEIKYKKVDEDYYHIGYSSYNIDNVLEWYREYFELVNAKMTNADRIRNMSDEELLDFICSIETYDEGSVKTIENGVSMHTVTEVRVWLQSEAE